MSSSTPLYHVKPVFQLPEKIDLPTCLYHVNKMNATNTGGEPAYGNGTVLSNILEKEQTPDITALQTRWDVILEQLSGLKSQMESIKLILRSKNTSCPNLVKNRLLDFSSLQNAVINVNPLCPPYSLLLIQRLYTDTFKIKFKCHIHSTVSFLPPVAQNYLSDQNNTIETADVNILHLTLIWKGDVNDLELKINPLSQIPILGEVNLLRYLARLGLSQLQYDTTEESTIYNDAILDTCHRLLYVRAAKEKQSLYRYLNAKLGKSTYFGGDNINISDIAVWSVLKQTEVNILNDLSQNLSKWFQRVSSQYS